MKRIMINLNQIRSLEPLEEIKQNLTDFIKFDREVMVDLYLTQYGWGEEDYDADLEQVKELLEKVNKRIKSLGNYLAKQNTKAS